MNRLNLDRTIEDDPIFEMVTGVASGRGQLYVFGDYILEGLFGRQPGGLLIACAGDLKGIAELLAIQAGLTPIPFREGETGFHLAGSSRNDRTITLVPLAHNGIEENLRMAGFTVSALGVDAADEGPLDLIDPLGGLADLEERRLRSVSSDVFQEDPARILHGVELAAVYGLEPDTETEQSMKVSAERLTQVDRQRTRSKIARLFGGRSLARKAGLLMRTGAFKALMPEIDDMFGAPQNYYHHLGVWDHTLEVLNILEYMIDSPAAFFPTYSGRRILLHLSREFEGGMDRRAFLGFAALIHDVGKPLALTVEPSGRIRFKGHQVIGGKIADDIGARIGLGRKGRRHLAGLVADHMRLGFLMKEGECARSRLKAIKEMDDRSIEIVMLSLADRMATRGEASTEDAAGRYKRMATRVLADYFWDLDFPGLIGGHDVMMHTGVNPGPEVGRALFKARVAQREAIVSTRQQALEYLAPDFKGKMSL